MRIHIVQSCFQPNGAKVPNILKLGTEHDLSDEQAKILLDKGYAVKVEVKKSESEEKAEKPSKKKADTPKA